jgi:glutaminyl-peptide cyclotransferase
MRARHLIVALLLAAPTPALADTPWSLIRSFPHDPAAFTQGLSVADGLLYETTGQWSESEVRAVRLHDGKVLRHTAIEPDRFGEGSTPWGDSLISLTWRHREGYVWRRSDLTLLKRFRYTGEGWGLANDGKRLILSDGTATLRFLDPEALKETGRLTVTWQGRPVPRLNELEVVDGELLANVWMTNRIARIDLTTGKVIDWIDLAPLAARHADLGSDAVLNGIAWDSKARRLYVTGKYWPKLYEIRLKK